MTVAFKFRPYRRPQGVSCVRVAGWLVVALGVWLAGCAQFLPPSGGNVGGLGDAEQAEIAQDLFALVTDGAARRTTFTISPRNHGEAVFAQACREAGYAVRHEGNENRVRLDFYRLDGEYVGVANLVGVRRIVRRYVEDGGGLVGLTMAVSWFKREASDGY